MAFEKAEIGAELHTIPHEAWDQQASDTVPLAKLNAKGTQVLKRFLQEWLHNGGGGPLYHEPGVDAEYDY